MKKLSYRRFNQSTRLLVRITAKNATSWWLILSPYSALVAEYGIKRVTEMYSAKSQRELDSYARIIVKAAYAASLANEI